MDQSNNDKCLFNIGIPNNIKLKNEKLRSFILDLSEFTGCPHSLIFEEAAYNEQFANCIYDYICDPNAIYTDQKAAYLSRFISAMKTAINKVDWRLRLKKVELKPDRIDVTDRNYLSYDFALGRPFSSDYDSGDLEYHFHKEEFKSANIVRHQAPVEEKIDKYGRPELRVRLSTFIDFLTALMKIYGDGYMFINNEYDTHFDNVSLEIKKYNTISAENENIEEEYIAYTLN